MIAHAEERPVRSDHQATILPGQLFTWPTNDASERIALLLGRLETGAFTLLDFVRSFGWPLVATAIAIAIAIRFVSFRLLAMRVDGGGGGASKVKNETKRKVSLQLIKFARTARRVWPRPLQLLAEPSGRIK